MPFAAEEVMGEKGLAWVRELGVGMGGHVCSGP